MTLRRQSLDALEFRNAGFSKRYNVLIPEGRITEYDSTEIPVVRNKTSLSRIPLESTGNLGPLLVQKSGKANLSVSAIDNQLRSIAVNRKNDSHLI
jgi:hypothetical protein